MGLMAKVLTHLYLIPNPATLKKIKVPLDSANWDYCISPLHDKDKKEDGTLKKGASLSLDCRISPQKIPNTTNLKLYKREVGRRCWQV